MTIEDLRRRQLIVLECLSGSRAYGLDTPESDTDIKGVFVLPKRQFYGLSYLPQVSNASHDVVFYELGRWLELLAVNNPNILELLSTPETAVIQRHPWLAELEPGLFLSKLCRDTFGKFALSQIKKARGLNKKIVNPVDKERKSLLHFCYVSQGAGSVALLDFLAKKGWRQEDCGLVNVPHMRQVYALFYDPDQGYQGIIRKPESNEVALSAIPRGAEAAALMYCNLDGYSAYCKEYRAYWDWVATRNEARYQSTEAHGKNYDAKNMMHVFRLLEMAIEIAREGVVRVQRPNRDFLLAIKRGEFAYDTLLKMADERREEMDEAFEASSLPDQPDMQAIEELAYRLREQFYGCDNSQP